MIAIIEEILCLMQKWIMIFYPSRRKLILKKVILIGHGMGNKVTKTLSIFHLNRIYSLVPFDRVPLYYNATNDVTWNGIHELMRSLIDTIVLNDSAKTKKDFDLKLRK